MQVIRDNLHWIFFSAYVALSFVLGKRFFGDSVRHFVEVPGIVIWDYVQVFFFLINKDDNWFQVPRSFEAVFGFLFYFLLTLFFIRFIFVLSGDIRERLSRRGHEV